MELRIFIEPQQGASYAAQLRMAQAAEELGYGAFFRSDHFLAMGTAGEPARRPTGAAAADATVRGTVPPVLGARSAVWRP